jgi:hypothetical protein
VGVASSAPTDTSTLVASITSAATRMAPSESPPRSRVSVRPPPGQHGRPYGNQALDHRAARERHGEVRGRGRRRELAQSTLPDRFGRASGSKPWGTMWAGSTAERARRNSPARLRPAP